VGRRGARAGAASAGVFSVGAFGGSWFAGNADPLAVDAAGSIESAATSATAISASSQVPASKARSLAAPAMGSTRSEARYPCSARSIRS
jgi:hypothetical protein